MERMADSDTTNIHDTDAVVGHADCPPMSEEQKKEWDEVANINTRSAEEFLANPSAYAKRKAVCSHSPESDTMNVNGVEYVQGEVEWPPMSEEVQKKWDEIAEANTKTMEEDRKLRSQSTK